MSKYMLLFSVDIYATPDSDICYMKNLNKVMCQKFSPHAYGFLMSKIYGCYVDGKAKILNLSQFFYLLTSKLFVLSFDAHYRY